MKLFLLVVSLLTFNAWAEDCSPVNLITEENSPFNKIPVYDQDGAGICYAYAAAQMMDYHLIKNGEQDRKIHPVWVALQYAISKDKDSLSYGHPDLAINSVLNSANCEYEVLEKGLAEWAETSNIPESELVSFMELFVDQLQTMKDYKKSSIFSLNTTLTENELQAVFSSSVGIHATELTCSDPITLANLYPKLKDLLEITPQQMLLKILSKSCHQASSLKTKIPKAVRKNDLYSNGKEVVQEISHYLDSSRAPIGINYCSNIFEEPKYEGVFNNFLRGSVFSQKKDCQSHVSIIVGKKKINNSCLYLIRNSWGSNWDKDNQKWKCLCKNKKTSEFIDDCTFEKHNGPKYSVEGCWLPSEILQKNVFSLTEMEAK